MAVSIAARPARVAEAGQRCRARRAARRRADSARRRARLLLELRVAQRALGFDHVADRMRPVSSPVRAAVELVARRREHPIAQDREAVARSRRVARVRCGSPRSHWSTAPSRSLRACASSACACVERRAPPPDLRAGGSTRGRRRALVGHLPERVVAADDAKSGRNSRRASFSAAWRPAIRASAARSSGRSASARSAQRLVGEIDRRRARRVGRRRDRRAVAQVQQQRELLLPSRAAPIRARRRGAAAPPPRPRRAADPAAPRRRSRSAPTRRRAARRTSARCSRLISTTRACEPVVVVERRRHRGEPQRARRRSRARRPRLRPTRRRRAARACPGTGTPGSPRCAARRRICGESNERGAEPVAERRIVERRLLRMARERRAPRVARGGDRRIAAQHRGDERARGRASRRRRRAVARSRRRGVVGALDSRASSARYCARRLEQRAAGKRRAGRRARTRRRRVARTVGHGSLARAGRARKARGRGAVADRTGRYERRIRAGGRSRSALAGGWV